MSGKAKRYVIAREHFAKARVAVDNAEAAPLAAGGRAWAAIADTHLRIAEFAKSWDSFFGGDIETGEPT